MKKAETNNLRKLRRNQRGMTLIVVLVILTAMTFLGLAAMSDSNMQLSMVRNSQLENMAYSAAMTEINAQIDLINAPGSGVNDPAIIAVVAAAPNDLNGDGIAETQIDTTNAALGMLAPAVLGGAAAGINQTLTLTQPNPDSQPIAENFSIDPNSGFRWRMFEFNSVVDIENTASNSDQTQGIQYLGAN